MRCIIQFNSLMFNGYPFVWESGAKTMDQEKPFCDSLFLSKSISEKFSNYLHSDI